MRDETLFLFLKEKGFFDKIYIPEYVSGTLVELMPDDVMLKCRLCGKNTPVKGMRYHKSGQYLICRDCSDRQGGGAIKSGTTQVGGSKAPLQKSETARRITSQKTGQINYKCTSCGYKFSRKESIDVSSCPYCSRETIEVSSGHAQELLDETANEPYF